MRLAAAKRTTQIVAPCVAGVGQKVYAAMAASLLTSSEVGLIFENRTQYQVILQHQSFNLCCSIPIRIKLKILADFDCKCPRLSLIVLMYLSMTSSYLIDMSVSRVDGVFIFLNLWR